MNYTQSQRIKFLLHTLNLTQQELASTIGISQSAVSQMINEKTTMSMETLQKISDTYGVDCNWLVKGEGEPFTNPNIQLSGYRPIMPNSNPDRPRDRVIAVTVAPDKNPNIVLVPVRAQAGYALSRVESTFLQELPSFSLPTPALQQGNFRAFEIDGDSMEPTLFKGDIIICRFVEDLRWLRDLHLYVVIVEGDILIKRVRNRIRQNGTIELISDNRFYPPITLTGEEVIEAWAVYARVTLQFNSPSESENTEN